ncbi:hypothetical protein NX722_01385 [Endozoicomonas gorgoniicola]|uniref:Uncharacterized protein n=1 Tax=Endozoicomonas gorgoniicola TaxID=1234144 RepID=A0ABT3MPL7_9GAMM|nr:hypothetical protein [Endozoicomonas gorgoniicola]MCW7551314.1 hypothetical protein [Endozoicomonas gorgoniicola]
MSGLFFLSISLASLSAMANPVMTGNGQGIVFDATCPNGEKICENHPVDCLGGCALSTTTGATVFKWERTLFETLPDKSSRVDIQAMKKCLSRDAVQSALLKAQEQTPGTGAEKVPCTATSSVWRYIYPKYTISLLVKDTCDTTRFYLDELTGSCQDWRNSITELGVWLWYAAVGIVGAVTFLAVTFAAIAIGGASIKECLLVIQKKRFEHLYRHL